MTRARLATRARRIRRRMITRTTLRQCGSVATCQLDCGKVRQPLQHFFLGVRSAAITEWGVLRDLNKETVLRSERNCESGPSNSGLRGAVVWRARLARFGKGRAAVMDQQDQLSINPSGKPEMFGTLGLTKPPKNYHHGHPGRPCTVARVRRLKINKLEKVPLKFAQEHMKKVHMEQIHWSIFTSSQGVCIETHRNCSKSCIKSDRTATTQLLFSGGKWRN